MKKIAIVKWLNNISIKRKLYFTVGIMGLLIITELFTLIFAVNTLSSVRAYVQGEGLYSKAQKDAVYHLMKYGYSRNEADYNSFNKFMTVLEGDRKARVELYKPTPDIQIARQGFIEGRNHPDDIDGMIKLFSRFNRISYINKAINLWNQADSIAIQLTPIAVQMHYEVNSIKPSAKELEKLVLQIHPINHKLTVLEDDFSYTLGEGSRWLENLIFSILFIIALSVETTGLLLGILISHGMSRSTDEIINAAHAVSAGNFNRKAKVFSKDEIGQIAVAFNQMIDAVQQSSKAQKEAEHREIELEVMRREERKFRIALEAAPSALIMLSEEGKIILVNKQTEVLFGYKRDELIGQEVTMLVPERYRMAFDALRVEFFKQPEKRNTGDMPGLYVLNRAGNEIPVEIGLNPIHTENRTVVLSSVTDISKRKREEEELREAKDNAERMSMAKQEFLSVMSHEMRTPLNAVIGISHLLSEDNLTAEQKENINILQFSAQNLLGLINNILDFSKIESCKLEMEAINFNINSLTRHVMDSFRHHAEEKQVELKLESDFNLNAELVGDPVRLTQVFTNLVHNALKFTDSGSVTLAIKTLGIYSDNVVLLFEVKDTGIGIEYERIDEIFDSYTQARPSITRQFGGTGLGLTICKKLVQLMGGNIHVRSKMGEGSVFSFNVGFPISSKENKSVITHRHEKDYNLKGVNLLLVEDNIINQVIAKKFIHRWGAHVDTAENGLDAVKRINEKRYDVVLMDLQMPVMDGYKANKIIRSMGFTADKLPVIALTANALEDVKAKVFESGMNDYLAKPIDPNELFKTIAKHLKKNNRNGGSDKLNGSDTPIVEKFDITFLMDSFDNGFRKEFLKLQQKEVLEFIPRITHHCRERNTEEIHRLTHKITPSLKRLDRQLLLQTLNELRESLLANAADEIIEEQLKKVCHECNNVLEDVRMLQEKYAVL